MVLALSIVGRRKRKRAVRERILKAAFLALAALIMAALPLPARAGHAHGTSGEPATFGKIDFENSCTRSVQAEFRTAVAMLHSFAADAKQFVDVAKHDPSCAIAWWGAAMAARGNPLVGELDRDGLKAGQEYLARARKLKTTLRERSYLDAMDIYYREYPNGGQLGRTHAYETAMERVLSGYPDDTEAAAFYGLAVVEAGDLKSRNYHQQLKAGKGLGR